MICPWVQEFLGCYFTVIHQPDRMLSDLDAIPRRFEPLLTKQLAIAAVVWERNQLQRPK